MLHRFFIIFLLLFLARPGNAVDPVQDRINLENAITAQIKSELSSLLPSNSYAIFTTVQLDVIKERELLQGEQVKLKGAEAEAVPTLPGFIPSLDNTGNSTEQERQVYTMREKISIAKVSVRILFDDGVRPALVDIAKATVNDKLSAGFGGKATAQFEMVDLISDPVPPPALTFDPKTLLKEYWWILPALFVFLVSLFFLFRRRRQPMEEQVVMEPNPMRRGYALPQGNFSSEFGHSEEMISEEVKEQRLLTETSPPPPLSETLKEFIEGISLHPLIARNFLQKLDSQNKKLLYSCLETSSLRDALGNLLGISEGADAETNADEETGAEIELKKRSMLSSIQQEFQQYKKLIELQLNQKFGFLSLLSADEIIRLLPQGNDQIVPLVMKYLPKEISKQILGTFSPSQKKTLMHQLIGNAQLPEERIDQIEGMIKERVTRLSKELFMPFSKNESLMDIIVENSGDETGRIFNDLFESDQALKEKYQSYLLGMDDLLEQEPGFINQCLEDLPNEAIAKALMGLEPNQKERLQSVLSDGRRKVISALLVSHGEGTSPEEIESARKQLLQTFRQRSIKAKPTRGKG